MSIATPPSFHAVKYTATACCFRSNRDTECYSSGKFAGKDSTTTPLTLICTLSVPADVLFHPNEIELAPSNVAKRDTENYTVKNTHVCCAVYVKSTVMSETVHVMPSGNCEVEMTLLLERQMKNIWTGVFVPMEHRQTTTDLSAISTEALSQYQTVFFWHTECYFQLLNVVAFQSTLRAATVPVVTLTNSWQT